ncbi:MAG: pilus assembly protein N-terminal domain-containing protein, partial [Candidatus Korobacteraceae bacterium]
MALSRRSKNGLSWKGTTCALFACTAFIFAALTVAAQEPAAQAPAMQAPAMQAPAPASSAQMPQQGGPESIHIVVGHSLLIRTPGRVKRILTGNPVVIESVVTSPAELVITAKSPG